MKIKCGEYQEFIGMDDALWEHLFGIHATMDDRSGSYGGNTLGTIDTNSCGVIDMGDGKTISVGAAIARWRKTKRTVTYLVIVPAGVELPEIDGMTVKRLW